MINGDAGQHHPAAFMQQPGSVAQEGASASNAQQLTIFYGGMVVVLDSCTPEQAAELIRLATAAAGQGAPKPPLVDMPIARKNSLHRFLAKRKERAAATAPAPIPDSEPVKDEEPAAKKGKLPEVSRREEAAPWLALGLGSLGSMQER